MAGINYTLALPPLPAVASTNTADSESSSQVSGTTNISRLDMEKVIIQRVPQLSRKLNSKFEEQGTNGSTDSANRV